MLSAASWLTGSSETDVRTACESESTGTRGVKRFADGMTSAATTTAATATAAVPAASSRGTHAARRTRAFAMSGERTSSQNPSGAPASRAARAARRVRTDLGQLVAPLG